MAQIPTLSESVISPYKVIRRRRKCIEYDNFSREEREKLCSYQLSNHDTLALLRLYNGA